MDVEVTIKVRVANLANPHDLADSGKTLVELADSLIRSEGLLREVEKFELLDARFIWLKPIEVQYRLPETQPDGRRDWHV